MRRFLFYFILLFCSHFLIGSNCSCTTSRSERANFDYVYFSFLNIDSQDIIIKVKKFYSNTQNSYKTRIYEGQILNVSSLSLCGYCVGYSFADIEPENHLYRNGINTLSLEIMDPWQTAKYAEINLNFTNYGRLLQVTEDSYWDKVLSFESQQFKNSEYIRYTITLYNTTLVYTATFSRAKIPLFADQLRNFRLWNNSPYKIKVKVYRSNPKFSEEYYYRDQAQIIFGENYTEGNYYYKSNIPFYETSFTPTEFANIFWQTSGTWESEINSGGVGTIFHSTLAYTGPYKIEIYDKATNLKLLEDKVRYPIFDEEEILKYKDSTNPFADGMRIRTKLEWYKKAEVPSSMLNISTISGYPNEFYAEYKGN